MNEQELQVEQPAEEQTQDPATGFAVVNSGSVITEDEEMRQRAMAVGEAAAQAAAKAAQAAEGA